MNSSIMMGRLVRDSQVSYIKNRDGDEVAVANFRIAVDRNFGEETDFFPCAAFGWLAEFTEKYLVQGIKIVVRGSMENDNYTNKDGEKVYGVRLNWIPLSLRRAKKPRTMTAAEGKAPPEEGAVLQGTEGVRVPPEEIQIPPAPAGIPALRPAGETTEVITPEAAGHPDAR